CAIDESPTDNAPRLDSIPPSVIRISESATVGSLILTLSGSDPEGATVIYGIDQPEPNYLSVGPVDGEVRIRQQLDAETDLFFQVDFTISDGTNLPVEYPSFILVTDVNDNAPQFVNTPYRFQVPEDAPIDYLITTISTTDPDTGIQGAEYQLLENTTIISVNLTSGRVLLKQQLNHEVTKTYQFTVQAFDLGSPRLENTTDFILEVQDVQDSLPVFVNTPYTSTVQENAPIGTIVTTVSAIDQDTGVPNVISYSIVGGNEAGFFYINPATGNVTVNSVIDRDMEGFSGIVQLTVMATELGSSGGANVSTIFSIMVEDVSDQAPIFGQPQYDVSISESAQQGQQLPLQILVSDADMGTNADFSLRLQGNHSELFSITPLQASGSTEVNLTLLQSLDYESSTSYSLQIVAVDTTNTELSSEATVMINVINENDNAPIFPPVPYIANLQENVAVGSPVIQVIAADNDLGSLGQITYTLSGSDRFAINSGTGEISVAQPLNYEESKNHVLTVTASDGGVPPRTADTSVTVYVTDVNDNAPQFTREIYEAYVEENEMYSVGREITTVRADDPDLSSNNLVNYFFLKTFPNGTTATSTTFDNFIIMASLGSGYIYTTQTLDFETIMSNPLAITVVAEDSEGLRDSATLNIHVIDKNDNAPVFKQPSYEATIPENFANGDEVLTVSATDSDGSSIYGSPSILYSLKPPNSYFTVNAVSGSVSTIATLEADDGTETIEFEVVAMDGGQGLSQMSSSAMVTIRITDVNDNDPVFVDNKITAYVPENATVGHLVAMVSTTDRDQLNNTDVTYSIISGNDNGFFTIDPLLGNISTTGNLDFETTGSFTLIILAEARTSPVPPATGAATAIVEVFLQDVNDNAPVFTKEVYNFQVSENEVPGDVIGDVSATDADSTVNAEIQYSIISGNENGLFTLLTQSRGVLTLAQPLDRETSPSHVLTIRAEDLGQPSLSSETTVRIMVLDANDNDPIWIQDTYSVNVTDGSSPGLLLQVQATDSDEGKNSQLIYTIKPPNADFFINSSTGELFTVTEIDREESSFITLFVNVRDDGDESRSATSSAEVEITVIDVNDNAPVSLLPDYSFTVEENSDSGTIVGRVQASDADSTSHLLYSFVNSSMEFTINITSGEITTQRSLDRESKAHYTLTAMVIDGKYSVSVPITITVVDVNDNAPQFTKAQYEVPISEYAVPGSPVIQVLAIDNDEGDNGGVMYSILDGNYGNAFRIDPATGRMQVATSLDREVTPMYTITILATDRAEGDAMSSTALVIVTILDENDNRPLFTQNVYTANVAEDVPMGTNIIQVSATDADVGVNADITFSIISGNENSLFAMNSTTGQISRGMNAFDFESAGLHSLIVQASNQDGEQSTATVHITIDDVNDEMPQFTQELYQRPDLSENALAGDVVVIVSATDRDTGSGGVVSYSIVAGDELGLFGMNPTSGALTVVGSLDYETFRNYTLTVAATDQSPPNNVGYANVKIMIVNVNDEVPRFERTRYTEYVYENVMVGYSVAQVTAIDRDGQASVVYSIDTNGDASNLFDINSTTGEITTKEHLDRETSPEISFTIFASDGGIERGSALFSVILLDVNDNKPMFDVSSEVIAEIMENSPIGSLVTSFIATDTDFGPNSQISYNFISGNEEGRFSLSVLPDGWVQVNTTTDIDREMQSSYLLNVSAIDNGIPSQHNNLLIRVVIQDANDNTPEFSAKEYSATIKENSVANTVVVNVQASDADDDQNGAIRYDITAGNPGVFAIDAISGNITTTYTNLDREVKEFYNLTVVARDLGSPSKKSTTYVEITVLDANDNAPIFEESSQTVNIIEGTSSVGIVVATVLATDADLGTSGDVQYFIEDGNIGDVFLINSTTGVITTLATLDREVVEEYVLTITAIDQDSNENNRKSSTATVTVQVEDINDVVPTFPSSFVGPIFVQEGIRGEYLGTYIAEDNDIGLSGNILYSLGNESRDMFMINSVTGILSLKINVVLDYETKKEYNISILATDRGSPALVGMMVLYVQVLDQNDNSPEFNNLPYLATVPENISVGASVFQVNAYDIDGADFQPIRLSIIEGNYGAVFRIDETGTVFVNNSLDRETTSLYELVIAATDNVQDPDNSRTVSCTFVVQLFASDPDGYPLTFKLDNGGLNKFTIDSSSGVITVATTLDFEQQKFFTLTISASDTGSSPQTGYSTVYLQILDINDSRPKFTKLISNYVIQENSPPMLIGNVTAEDDDTSSNISYTVMSLIAFDGNSIPISDDSLFQDFIRLDSMTGDIYANEGIDREIAVRLELTINARDLAAFNPDYYDSDPDAVVRIEISDVNDNAPAFSSANIIQSVAEGTPIGTVILNVNANDPDSGLSGAVLYTLINTTEIITIDNTTGQVTLTQELDREANEELTFLIKASDGGVPSLSSILHLDLLVLDINDNNPVFSQTYYHVEIPENIVVSADVIQVTATDIDEGSFGTVMYSLSGGQGKFSINQMTGLVIVSAPLDKEEQGSYTLTVTARDNPSGSVNNRRESSAQVIVTVEDVNEFPPLASMDQYTFEVEENLPADTLIGQVVAEDPDNSPNQQLTFTITNSTSPEFLSLLRINSSTGELFTTVSLDRESNAYPSTTILTIEISDNGFPQMSSQPLVEVEILDVNDNDPEFLSPTYYANISEDSSIETLEISSENETNKQMRIRAAQQTRAMTELLEKTARYYVGRCIAVDNDAGSDTSQIIYSIIGGNSAKAFAVNSSTGELETTTMLDRELVASYTLIIQASNQDGLASTTQVSITIEDINDVVPHFEPSFLPIQVLSESVDIGTVVVTVTAKDEDEGANGEVVYSIIGGNDGGVFTIDQQSGTILTVQLLSEQNPQVFTFDLVVMAMDEGDDPLSSTTVVSIKINDENNHKPVFISPVAGQRLTVPENVDAGYLITIVSATDGDAGDSSIITYGFDDSRTEDHDILLKFSIDPNTGRLLSNTTFDREMQETYTLVLTAQDNGVPRQTTQQEIIIEVSDVNDNEPGFPTIEPGVPPVQVMSVPEGAVNGTYVGTVMEAVDPDKEKDYYYFIVDGNDPVRFNLNKDSGELFVVGPLDREVGSAVSLIVKVSSDPVYTTTQRRKRATTDLLSDRSLLEVIINLEDVNDNGPVFAEAVYIAGVPAEADPGTEIFTMTAVDADSAEHTSTEYAILATASVKDGVQAEADSTFSIYKKTGLITLSKKVDGDAYEYFDITVRAMDTLSSIESLANLKVYVLDPNERVALVVNAPIEDVQAKQDQLIEVLSNITRGIVFIDDIVLYTTENEKGDPEQTLISLNVVDPETNEAMPADVVLMRIDENFQLINALFDVVDSYPVITGSGGQNWALLEIALIAIAILIFIGTLAFCVIVCCLRKSYRKKLSMRHAVSFGNAQNLLDNNPYDYQGDNPFWLDGEASMSDWPDSISLIDSRQVPYRDGPMDFFSGTTTFDASHKAKNGTIQNALPPPPPPPGQSSSNTPSEASSIELLKQELAAYGSSLDPRAIPINESELEETHSGMLTPKRVKEIHQMLEELTSTDSAAAAYRQELDYDNQLSTIAEEEASMISSLTEGSSLEHGRHNHDLYAKVMRPTTIQEDGECADVSSESTSSSTQATVLSVTTYKLKTNGDKDEPIVNGHVTEIESEESDSESDGCKKHTYTVNHSSEFSDDDSVHDSDKNSDISTTTAKQRTYVYTINADDDGSKEQSEAANQRLRVDMGGEVALSDDSSVELMQEISDNNNFSFSGVTNPAFHEEETHL
ncbi:cadherin-23-like, partial [Anneissia japonica]|uniref:cadherin-23-like n=1 Tax=Anneissia japonica TaxID=1529436 RepID=UPI001425B5DA